MIIPEPSEAFKEKIALLHALKTTVETPPDQVVAAVRELLPIMVALHDEYKTFPVFITRPIDAYRSMFLRRMEGQALTIDKLRHVVFWLQSMLNDTNVTDESYRYGAVMMNIPMIIDYMQELDTQDAQIKELLS